MVGRLAPILALLFFAGQAGAQEMSLSLGEGGSISLRTIQFILLLTVLSLAPAIAITITCFPFVVTVLSVLRQGIGLQQSPPNMLIVSLALFLTWFVMEPVFNAAWQNGISPMLDEKLSMELAFERTLEPFRAFMAERVDRDTFAAMAGLRPDAALITEGGGCTAVGPDS